MPRVIPAENQRKRNSAAGKKRENHASGVVFTHCTTPFGDQIIIRVADDFDFGKFANRQLSANINPSVNVRRIRLAAAHKVMAFHWLGCLSVSRIKPYPRDDSPDLIILSAVWINDPSADSLRSKAVR
jgi:hypothetical protein